MVSLSMNDVWMALLGGALMGLAAAGMYVSVGRIMGVSGILFGVVVSPKGRWEALWRASFIVGLLLASWIFMQVSPEPYFSWAAPRSITMGVIGGFMVGVGSTVANGCTTGHGICGISRISLRSLLATGLFIVAGALIILILGGQ